MLFVNILIKNDFVVKMVLSVNCVKYDLEIIKKICHLLSVRYGNLKYLRILIEDCMSPEISLHLLHYDKSKTF